MENQIIQAEVSSEKNFGIVFAIVFALLGIFLSWNSATVAWWSFAISAVFLLVALIRPASLKYPNIWWFKFGMLLGAIIAPIVMALVYITTLVPMGLFVRLTRKDILHLKFNRQASSYWIQRETPLQPMKNQF